MATRNLKNSVGSCAVSAYWEDEVFPSPIEIFLGNINNGGKSTDLATHLLEYV